jgi:Tfp pilus assembly protein PilZ
MTPEMEFECLVVSRDPAVFCTVDRILHDLSIHMNMCPSYTGATKFLAESSTDLVVIDWEGEPSSELLDQIHEFATWRKPTVVAISAMDRAMPGVHVILRKPITRESGTKSFKTAYSRILRGYRKHTRFALMTKVLAVDDKQGTFSVTVTNIGEGGVGLATNDALEIGSTVTFPLPLPGLKNEIQIEARVLWTRSSGVAGCEFVHIPATNRQILRAWLESKYRIKRPLIPV